MSVATTSDFEAYKSKVAGLPADRFIGSVLWFSIAGSYEQAITSGISRRTSIPVRVTRTQLETWFNELGLDTAFLPPEIKKIDAFRKASSETERCTVLNEHETERLFFKEIDFNPEFVLRHVHREVTNKKTQTTMYAHVATLKFMRGARSASGKRHSAEHYTSSILSTLTEIGLDGKPTGQRYKLEDADRQRIHDFLKVFDARYTDLTANLTSDAIRNVVRNYVTSLNAIILKASGGVYFVHSSRSVTLDALEQLVKRVGPGCLFHQVPLIDTDDQRVMLTEALQSEVETECQRLLGSLAELNEKSKKKGGKITAAQYANLKAEWDELAARSAEYTEVLGLAQGRAGAAMELALESIVDLIDRIDIGSKK